MSNLDVDGKDCQVGPMCYQEARDRIQLKMVNSFLPTQAPPSGGKAGAKAGRLSGGKQARVKQADPQTDRQAHTHTHTHRYDIEQADGHRCGRGVNVSALIPSRSKNAGWRMCADFCWDGRASDQSLRV